MAKNEGRGPRPGTEVPARLLGLLGFLAAFVHVGTRSIHGRQTHVIVDRVRSCGSPIPDIHAAKRRKRHRDLHRRIPHHNIAPDDIARHARDEHDPVGVAGDLVVLDHVVVGAWRHQADAEVAALGRVAVAAQPVRTEPVMVAASGQSYAATRVVRISIANRNVLLEIVVGRRERHENTGKAVAVGRDALDRHARRRPQANAKLPEPLHDARAQNDLVVLHVHIDAHFTGSCRGAWCLQVGATGHREAVEFQRQPRCAERNAGGAGDGARHVADKPTVIEDRQRARDRATDVSGLCRMRKAHRQEPSGDGCSTHGMHDHPPGTRL
jgi:hypothetical protein